MIIIGENINATIPKIKKMITAHDGSALLELAKKQEAAGAGIIDINVGTGEGTAADEINDMKWLVELVGAEINGKICVDSSDPAVLKAGIETGEDKIGLVNSVKADEKSIAEIMPLVSEHNLPVIALAMDEGGIPKDPETRLRACEKIVKGAQQHNVPEEHIYFDPLVMPISTDNSQGMTTLETLKGINSEFPGTKSVLAVSNVSFGLPQRTIINQTLIHMAQIVSVEALIINPLDEKLMLAVKAGEAVLGRDRHCRKYSRAARNTA